MIKTDNFARVRNALFAISILGIAVLPQSARAMVLKFTDMTAVMLNTPNVTSPGGTISLLVDSSRFGPGGFAGGGAEGDFDSDGDVDISDLAIWEASFRPADGTPAISFTYDAVGNLSPIDPTPFRLLVGTSPGPPTIFGELDFSGVTGTLGSLNLAGVVVWEVDAAGDRTGTVFDVNPFTIHAVPLPAAAWMFLTALGGLGLFGWRRRRAA